MEETECPPIGPHPGSAPPESPAPPSAVSSPTRDGNFISRSLPPTSRFGKLAAELGRSGVHKPAIETDLSADSAVESLRTDGAALRRVGTANDVTGACFLLSDQARWISSQSLNFNGGY